MKYYKRISSFSIPLLIAVSLSGCITNKVLETAKDDRRNEKVTAINSQYVDTANLLVVNFTAKFPGHKKGSYHISVPVDTLIAAFQYRKALAYYPDSLLSSTYKLNRVYRVTDSPAGCTGLGIAIELNRDAVVEGFYIPPGASTAEGRIVNYRNKKGFRYEMMADENYLPSNAKHPVLLFYPAQANLPKYNTRFKTDYIALSLAPSNKRKYTRYALLPLTAAGDLVTLPLQAIGVGFLALMAYGMKY